MPQEFIQNDLVKMLMEVDIRHGIIVILPIGEGFENDGRVIRQNGYVVVLRDNIYHDAFGGSGTVTELHVFGYELRFTCYTHWVNCFGNDIFVASHNL